MYTFELLNDIWEAFSNDEELLNLLSVEDEDDYSYKIRLANVEDEEFSPDRLPVVASWFLGVDETFNGFINQGYLCIDIYTESINDAQPIAKRIIEIFHNRYNIRVKGGGQYQSELSPIYKYRIVFKPLVFN